MRMRIEGVWASTQNEVSGVCLRIKACYMLYAHVRQVH